MQRTIYKEKGLLENHYEGDEPLALSRLPFQGKKKEKPEVVK